jgi:flagellar protein FlbD
MIPLTRLNHHPVFLNPDLVKYVDTMPDSVITLTSGEKILVLETAQQILDLMVEFRQRVLGVGARTS